MCLTTVANHFRRTRPTYCLAVTTANSVANAAFRRCSNPYRKSVLLFFFLRNTFSIASASLIACRFLGVSDAQEGFPVQFVEHKCKREDES